MLFNSYIFILAFLPVTLAGYFGLARLFRKLPLNKVWLVGCSLVFYAYFNVRYLPIIVLSILVNYALSQGMLAARGKGVRALLLAVGLLGNLGVLGYYKYYDFFVQNVNALAGTSFVLHRLVLPLGISFFTFQQLSYVIDSYKRTVPRYGLIDYSLFVTFFPQLIAGPIVLHSEIVPQFADPENRRFRFENFAPGLYAFALGLFKKVIVADTFAKVAEWGFGPGQALNTPEAWFVAFAFAFQLYFDFSGYCDMAMGLGRMFNINIPQNFNSPYKAQNIKEFWQRWHITLSRFFTNYIYFPMGGSRKGTSRTCANLMVVFLVSGLWHGAGWLFILWGALHGLMSVLYRVFRKQFDRLHPALSWLITFLFVVIAWVFFRATDMQSAMTVLRAMFTMNFGPLSASITNVFTLPMGLHPGYNAIVTEIWYALALFGVLGLPNTFELTDRFKPTFGRAALTVALLTVSILSLSGVSVFLYYNF